MQNAIFIPVSYLPDIF